VNRPSARRSEPERRSGKRGTDATASSWEGAGRVAARRRAAGDPDASASRTADPATARPGRATPRRPTAPGRVDGAAPDRGWATTAVPGARTPVDPPVRARRRFGIARPRRRPAPAGATRRPVPVHYRRRRLVAALAAVLVLLVGVGLGTRVLLYDAGLADVEDVTVSGLSTVPEQAVRDAAAVPSGGPLISVDTAGIAARVAALEGVAQAEVRRAWPHTVEVVVTERVPVALWPTPQALFEVDTTGLPYRRAPEPPPALPRLGFAGVAPQDPSTTAALTVLRDLSDPLRAQVASVDVAGTKVTLRLADNRSIRWGDPDRAVDKIAVLGPLLAQPGSVYDVSSPDLPTVRP
jgi:cell division protein FtsQ